MSMSEYRLEELCEILDSKRVPLSGIQRAKRQGPYPYYGAQSVIDYVDDYLLDGEFLLVAEDGANLVTRTQDIANIVNGKIWVNNHAHILGYNGKCPLQLLGFILNHSNISPYVTGCAQPKLNQDNLRRITIKLPEKVDEVASILSALDDKIAVNRRICENLESQAQALFKHWFIDFAPFKDGKFVESELGMIPEGWRVGKLGDVAEFKRGKTITKGNTKEGQIPVVAGGLEPAYYHNESNTSSRVITISGSGANAGFTRMYYVPVWASDCSFVDSASTSFIHTAYCYLLSNKKNVDALQWGAAQPHVYAKDINKLPLTIAPFEVLIKFEDLVFRMFDSIEIYEKENLRLSTLRDTLLPKLMSGQIKL